MWSALPKIQRHVVTLSYSQSDNTTTAATVALTTGGATNLQPILFLFEVQGRSDLPPW
jgi:hypothetical protein